MKKDEILVITALLVSVLAVLPQMECHLRPRPLPLPLPLPLPNSPARPLCASQLSLVNYACSMLSYSPALPVAPPSPPSPETPLPSPPHDDESMYSSRHGHRHGHQHERRHGHQHERRHGHQHGRRHGHRGSDEGTPEEENCCRWLKAVDSECVCDLLIRLPIFLARPGHAYTVIVDEICNVTYSCSGRLRV